MRHPKGIIALPLAFVLVVLALAAAGGSWWYAQSKKTASVNTSVSITTFIECEAAGYPVMESYPRQCAANGQTFVEVVALNTNTTVAANTNVATNTNTSANANTNTATDPTAGWKVYTNTQYDYSLKYPEGWRVSDFDTQYVRVIPPGGDDPNRQTASPSMQIDFIVVPGTIPVKTLTSPKKITIDGEDATQGVIAGVPDLFAIQISVDGGVLQIAWTNVNEFTDTLNKMVSTFTFLDETAGWKTYTDSESRFTFRYPANGVINTNAETLNQAVYVNALPGEDGPEYLYVHVYANPSKLTIKQWVEKIKAEPDGPPELGGTFSDRVQGESTLVIGDVAGVKLLTFQFDSQGAEVYVAQGTRVFKISYLQDDAGNFGYSSADRELYETILSTFTFTK